LSWRLCFRFVRVALTADLGAAYASIGSAFGSLLLSTRAYELGRMGVRS
jgi:hypothetical protein